MRVRAFQGQSGMRYTRRGTGKSVILLHGWCLNGQLWTYTEERLAQRFDVIVPDLAGFGASADLAGQYTLERYAQDVASLCGELRLNEVSVVGFAFGAAVAMTLAARGNRSLARLVNVGVPSAEASPYEKMPRSMRRDWPDFAKRSAVALFHNRQSDATLQWVERMFASAPLQVAIETVGELARFDAVALCSRIAADQVFVQGSADAVAPLTLAQACVEASPRARIEMIEPSGHLIVLDAKDAFNDLLETLLDGHQTPATTGPAS